MNARTLLGIGVAGSVATAICCFTPVLVLLFAGVGLSAAIVWLDWVLLPLLAVFLMLTGYALLLRWRKP